MSEEQIAAFLKQSATRADVVIGILFAMMIVFTLLLIRALVIGD